MEVPSSVTNIEGSQNEEQTKSEEATQEKNPITIVSSLAEKAMSVAGPVVPTKDDGEVDQERWKSFKFFSSFLICFFMNPSLMLVFVKHVKTGRCSSRIGTEGWIVEISW